jgi:hypothetical protein
MQYDRWNREDAFRSRLLRADRKAAEREYFENLFFGAAMPVADEKRERPSNPPIYFSGLGGIDNDPTDQDQDKDYGIQFEKAGSRLRASSPSNPRNLPCPRCKTANRLTPKDRALGYQCDSCRDAIWRRVD